ncbi:MAG: nucleotide sugar dehydrogenase [bacterium]|nr:nucleotide sugar dehydrogenase [bacterium]
MTDYKITTIGLGYVGLPLAVELSKHFPTKGFDINETRIKTIRDGHDPNGEVSDEDLQASNLEVSADPAIITEADVIIVAVPTPIDDHKIPDLTPVIKASETVGKHMKKGAIVCYESTVYPGVTEDECVPVLERVSGMKWKEDFFVGYSPERINPGDKIHTFVTITKVVSGDTPETMETLAEIYGAAVKAGIYKASSIKVAEAAKVIENTQRDINIALMNELKIIFDKMNISTRDVLEAAGTKWNFLNFSPGLVGGHCIGVDPYYLAYKAEEIGHHPQIIQAGRRINDAMGRYFARNLIKMLIDSGLTIKGSRVLIMGITFKEDVPDIRNTRVIDIIKELEDFHINVDIWDPVAYPEEVKEEYGIELIAGLETSCYHGIIPAVKHKEIISMGTEGIKKYLAPNGVLYDIKEML